MYLLTETINGSLILLILHLVNCTSTYKKYVSTAGSVQSTSVKNISSVYSWLFNKIVAIFFFDILSSSKLRV